MLQVQSGALEEDLYVLCLRPLRDARTRNTSPSGKKVSQVRALRAHRRGVLGVVFASPSRARTWRSKYNTFFPEGDVLRVRASLRLHVRAQKSRPLRGMICAEAK